MEVKFPSPYGAFVFLPQAKAKAERLKARKSFRPLTGLLFFYQKAKLQDELKEAIQFPSPYGAFVFLP